MATNIDYVLGIDLGSASLGWAVIEQADGGPRGLAQAGVRVFSPGVDGNLDRGQEDSRNLKRREARLHRRQLRRRTARQRDLFLLLQAAGLLPKGADASDDFGVARQKALDDLDKQLWQTWKQRMLADDRVPAAEHVVPYYLRARGLEERLEPNELGRALYHLGQRRGFKSNRKAQPKKDEKPGEVAEGISELKQEMQGANARTLGEYFTRIDPNAVKIRRRWTERAMFVEEFQQLWEAQRKFHSAVLSDALRRKIDHLLFFQRPLRDNDALVGECELEKGEKRAPWATLEAQRFRLLQRVNDMEVEEAGGQMRPLTAEERSKIVETLEQEGDHTFAALRKLIGLKGNATRFNFERGGEKNCRGNRTAEKMREVFGARWDAMSPVEKGEIVEVWRKVEESAELERMGRERWGLDAAAAARLSDPKNGPEPKYCGFSRKAIAQLMPLLESGIRLQTAIKTAYPERNSGAIYDVLPPARTVLALRNPAIERAMSDLRKVVNAVVRRYGKPAAVRIELARDLKKSREERKRIWTDQRGRESSRAKAAAEICKEVGRASREDIEKYMLAEECDWGCPYTGKPINVYSLFTAPEFQVEHILPLGRFPDNSFQNKTLCHVSANADKNNRTPWEAFHGDEERWASMLERVKRFRNPAKLRRFQMTPEQTEADKLLNEFTERQLNDTRYASKDASKYLGLLYGGRDEDGRRRVFASSGAVTATLRQVWGLNGILGLKGEKNRDDHRHHAVDAIVIGLTSEAVIKHMADASQRNRTIDAEKQHRPFKGLQPPWKDFVESIRTPIEGIHVSHRPENKLSGPLHEETLYGKPYRVNGKLYVNIRKPLAALTKKDVEAIVDKKVREAVENKLAGLGGDVKKLNAISPDALEQLPWLAASDGRRIAIKRVRIRKTMNPVAIGKGARERQVQPGNNHHLEVFSVAEIPGKPEQWVAEVVSLLEATERKRNKLPVIKDRHPDGDDYRFMFSLMNGDMVEMDDHERGGRNLFIVRKISEGSTGRIELAFVRHTEARRLTDMTTKDFLRIPVGRMREWNCHKVALDPLGRVHHVGAK